MCVCVCMYDLMQHRDVSMLDQWCNNNWRNGSALLQAEIKQNPYLVAQ